MFHFKLLALSFVVALDLCYASTQSRDIESPPPRHAFSQQITAEEAMISAAIAASLKDSTKHPQEFEESKSATEDLEATPKLENQTDHVPIVAPIDENELRRQELRQKRMRYFQPSTGIKSNTPEVSSEESEDNEDSEGIMLSSPPGDLNFEQESGAGGFQAPAVFESQDVDTDDSQNSEMQQLNESSEGAAAMITTTESKDSTSSTTEDKEIPEKYIDPLTLVPMNDPMNFYFKGKKMEPPLDKKTIEFLLSRARKSKLKQMKVSSERYLTSRQKMVLDNLEIRHPYTGEAIPYNCERKIDEDLKTEISQWFFLHSVEREPAPPLEELFPDTDADGSQARADLESQDVAVARASQERERQQLMERLQSSSSSAYGVPASYRGRRYSSPYSTRDVDRDIAHIIALRGARQGTHDTDRRRQHSSQERLYANRSSRYHNPNRSSRYRNPNPLSSRYNREERNVVSRLHPY